MPTQPNAASMRDVGKAVMQLTQEIKRMGVAAAATSAIFGTMMTRTAKLFAPAEAIRFEYRLRDLGAVVGSILHPSFVKLSDTVHRFATYLLNLDDGTKKLINTFVTWTVPITAAAIAFGGLATVMRQVAIAGSAIWGTGKLLSGLAGFSSGAKGAAAAVGGSVAAAAGAAATGVITAGGGTFMGMPAYHPQGSGLGGGVTPSSPKGPGFFARNKGRFVKGGLLAAGVAGATAMSMDSGESFWGSAGSGALTGGTLGAIGGPKGAAIGAILGAITGGIKYAFSGPSTPGKKSPDGMAPREVESFSSVLDPGRKLRMNSLATGGLPGAMNVDRSKDPADKIAAVMKAEAAVQRGFWRDFINELKGEFGGRKTQ